MPQRSQGKCTGGVTVCSEECVRREVKGGVRGWGYHLVGGVCPQGSQEIYTEVGFPYVRKMLPTKESREDTPRELSSGGKNVSPSESREVYGGIIIWSRSVLPGS